MRVSVHKNFRIWCPGVGPGGGGGGGVYKLVQINQVQATHLLLSNNSCVHLLYCCSWFMCLGFYLLNFVAYIDSSICIELEVNLATLRDIFDLDMSQLVG